MPIKLPASARQIKARGNKYGATRVQMDGFTFASKAESRRYIELKALEASGHITDLKLQPVFVLAPGVKYTGAARATPPLRYQADFSYVNFIGETMVEDVKGGPTTGVFRMKKHLMLAVLGIEVTEVRMR